MKFVDMSSSGAYPLHYLCLCKVGRVSRCLPVATKKCLRAQSGFDGAVLHPPSDLQFFLEVVRKRELKYSRKGHTIYLNICKACSALRYFFNLDVRFTSLFALETVFSICQVNLSLGSSVIPNRFKVSVEISFP